MVTLGQSFLPGMARITSGCCSLGAAAFVAVQPLKLDHQIVKSEKVAPIPVPKAVGNIWGCCGQLELDRKHKFDFSLDKLEAYHGL